MAKGGDFEREIARKLSLWFTGGERDDIFGRSDGSGGRFTSRRKSGKDTANQSGDITFTDVIGEPLIKRWSIELKTGYADKSSNKLIDKKGKSVKILYRWDLLDLIDSTQKVPIFIDFWNQTKRDADLSGRTPVLIFRRNLRTECICFSRGYFHNLVDTFGFPDSFVIQVGKRICVLGLSGFFKWVPDIRCFLGAEDGFAEKIQTRGFKITR